MATKDEEVNKILGNFGLTILGAILEAEANEHNPKNAAWNIVSNIGKDMRENPDTYRVIIENIIDLYEKNNR